MAEPLGRRIAHVAEGTDAVLIYALFWILPLDGARRWTAFSRAASAPSSPSTAARCAISLRRCGRLVFQRSAAGIGPTTSAGSRRTAYQFSDQWRCGPVTLPVAPTVPIRSPGATCRPTVTSMLSRCW
jgi:hypothetical protein